MRYILPCLLALSVGAISSTVKSQEGSFHTDLGAYLPRTEADAFMADVMSRHEVILPDVVLAQTATISISAGPRSLTVPVPGCTPGDRMVMTPNEAAPPPSGYMLGDIRCTAPGTAVATLYAPLLAIGGGYSITARVTSFR